MCLYYITSSLTTLTCLVLGIFVLFKNPGHHLHRSLFRLNMAVAFWSLFLFLHYLSAKPSDALLTLRLLHLAVFFIPSCYIHFIVNLLDIRKRSLVRIAYAISCLFLAVSLSPEFISGIEPKMGFKYYATAGSLYITWIAAYTLMVAYGIYLMFRHYKASVPLKKNQIRYVIFASLIGFAGGATIYPLFYDIEFGPVGEHIIFLYPVIFTLAVLKHNLLDLNVVIRRALIYSISVLLITLAYLLLVLFGERCLRDMVGYQSIWSTLMAAVAIALLFTPVKNRVESFADRIYTAKEYQRFKKELLESDRRKAIANLAAGMAHEIRNPLTAIKTFSEYLPEKFDDPEFRANFSRIVGSETDKINSLIIQLLEFAKPTALKIESVNIHDIIDYTLDLLSAEMLKYAITIEKDYMAQDPLVKADRNKMRHLFFNIIRNAIESMESGGRLSIETLREEKLRIRISDTGLGIKASDMNKIFEPFYSSKEHGTGLGLAVVQTIIAEHDASISAESMPGIGTTFTIIL